jgi:hypothetical protein
MESARSSGYGLRDLTTVRVKRMEGHGDPCCSTVSGTGRLTICRVLHIYSILADPRSRSHRTGSTPALIARGAGFGQGSAKKRWNAVLDFLLKYQQQIARGQVPPDSPGACPEPEGRGKAGAGLSRQPLGGFFLRVCTYIK